ncbi:hypothetical protein A1O3_01563 [Capronia epimyces CBS 606.96]|uniref:Uncharacterized protein n=1 Tax=Capronia epimyces CBS 606.96 TaxID=1182542 RepID=W9YJD2_9EURO|nr:uncharacterized protein A1O3_01563 [Capronia epimyces CBS 606.96]EXJ93007.1 hypothetical protein A1O3_01563 [Capronia epimyces CBS 606.96]
MGTDHDLHETPSVSNGCNELKWDSEDGDPELVSAATGLTNIKQQPEIDNGYQAPQDNGIQFGQVHSPVTNEMEMASGSGTELLQNNSRSDQAQLDYDQVIGSAFCHQAETALKTLDGNVADMAAQDYYIDNQPPSPTNAVKQCPKAAGQAPIHSSKVRKAPGRARARRLQFCSQPTPAHSNPQQPSEEDLLYILMSRARETATAMDRLACLEEQNRHLVREKELTARALKEAITTQNRSVQQQEILTQALDDFKAKYYKLKKWALEANKDCEVLQTQALGFKASLTDLIKDRDEVRAQLEDACSASGDAARRMRSIRSEVGDLSTVAQSTISAVDRMDGLLLAQAEHLRSEKQKCRKLETHIVLMQHERHKHDSRLHCQNQALNETLRGMTNQLEALETRNVDESVEQGQLMECRKMLQTLLDSGLSTNADLGSLRQMLGSMNELLSRHATHANSTSETFQAAIEALKEQLQNETSAQTATLLSEVQSGNKELIQAREEIAHLHQRSDQADGIVELLRNGKSIAESREKHLQSTTEKLIAALGDHKEATRKQSIDFENQNRSLLTKWQSACSQLAECKQQKEGKQEEIKGLKVKLLESETNQQALQQELEKSQEQIHHVQRSAEQRSKEQLDQMELELRQIQVKLNHEQEKHKEKEEVISRLKMSQSEVQRHLEKSEAERMAIATEGHGLQTRIGELEANLALVQQRKESLEQTNKSLQEKSAELSELKQRLKDFENLKEHHKTQQLEINEKNLEIQSLSEQMQQLQHRSAVLEEQIQQQHMVLEEKNILENELVATQHELREMADVKNELHQRNAAVAKLESVLAVAQQAAAKAPELEGQTASLKEQLVSLKSDLEDIRKENEEIGVLRKSVQDREDEIVQLKERLGAFNARSIETTGIKEALQRKEEDISTLQNQILTLEGAVSNAKLDQQTGPVHHPRRAADRSGAGAGNSDNNLLQAVHAGHVAHVAVTHQLPGSCTVVPDTQLDPPQEDDGGRTEITIQQPGNKEDSASELSEYTDNGSDPEHSMGNLVRKKPKTGLSHKQLQNHPQQKDIDPPSHLQVTERTPSSSYGSVNDQMLLDQVAQDDSQLDNLSGVVSGPDDDLDYTPASGDHNEALSYDRSASTLGRNPRGLRSGPRTRTRDSTPFPEPTVEPRVPRESTPAVMRERYQPNSAAKRRVERDEVNDENDGQPRRLKRRPANLDIRPPRASTQKPQTGDQAASRVTQTFRKSSSVVGTNAPAPGKSQRASRPARRGSRQDKYTTRFAT